MDFVNTGLDESILKSFDVEHPSEELVKAMNRQGLVQKEVQVKGKNGQTFTRKQWVKASEAKSDTSQHAKGSPVDISKFSFKNYLNPDGQNKDGYKTYRDTLQSVAKETEKAVSNVLSTYGGSHKPYDQLQLAFRNINGHSAYRDMISNSSEQGLKDAQAAINSRQKELLESVKDYIKWDGSQKKWVKAEGKSKPSLSDIQGYGYDPATATGDPTYLKIGDKGYFKIGNNKWQYNPSQGSALGGTYTDSQISDIVSKTSEEVKVMPSAKKNSKGTQSDTNGNKLSPSEAKAKTKEMTSKVTDKKSFMEKAKAQGITWKENDHEGINWMRCCMAMNKHFENGGSWGEKAPKSTSKEAEAKSNTENIEMNKQKDKQTKKVTNFGGKQNPYSWMSKEENEKLSSIPKYVDKPVEQWGDYSITQGNYHENFKSIDELKSALKFRGLPSSLANFDVKKFKSDDGYIQNDYQNVGVYAYPEVNPDWDKAYDEASKAARKRRMNG